MRKGRYLRTGAQMTDKDVILKLHDVFGVGRVIGPYERAGNLKDMYVWEVSRSEEAYAVGVAVYPFMGERRQNQIEEQFEIFSPPYAKVGRGRTSTHRRVR